MTDTSITLPEPLLTQAEALAQRLNLTPAEVVALALEQLITSQAPTTPAERVIHQGDIYWLSGTDSDIAHPHVVIQDDLLNHSRIHTVVVCALTSNSKRAGLPGNVALDAGEANLTRPSVVEVAKISSVPKTQLGEYIGTINESRIQQIFAGLRFLQTSYFNR